MNNQEYVASKDELLQRIQCGYPFAEQYHLLDKKRGKLEKAKGAGWLIYVAVFFLGAFLSGLELVIGQVILVVQVLGGFLWLPKVYGKVYSLVANKNKLIEVNASINQLFQDFTDKTGIYYEYITIYALERIEKYISSGRADSFKEAYNLLEAEMKMDQQLALQQKQHKEMMRKLSSIDHEVSLTRMNSYRD